MLIGATRPINLEKSFAKKLCGTQQSEHAPRSGPRSKIKKLKLTH